MHRLHDVDALTLRQWLEDGKACLIDVREPHEFRVARISGAILEPLSSFSGRDLPSPQEGVKLVFFCKAGVRSAKAARLYMQEMGVTETYHLKGGIDGWAMANCPVEVCMVSNYRLQRLVNAAVGFGVMLFTILAVLVHPAFLVLPLGLSALLIHAAITGTSLLEWFLNRYVTTQS